MLYGSDIMNESSDILNEKLFYKPVRKLTPEDLSKGGDYIVRLMKEEIENIQGSKLTNSIIFHIRRVKPKDVTKYCRGIYYAIVGNCFYYEVPKIRNEGANIKYNPKYRAYWSFVVQILRDKDKERIIKDARASEEACKKVISDPKFQEFGKAFIDYYKAYLQDLKYIK